MELLQDELVACHHCGDPCDHSIEFEDHPFCCYGCRAVYELLETSDLKGYYEETSRINQSFSELKAERKYAFLDNDDIKRQLLSFKNESVSVIRFFLPGIHCSSCIYLLEQLPKLDQRVVRSAIHFTKKQVTITYQHDEISLKEIAVLLSQLGYPPEISLESLDKTRKRVVKSTIGIKIAVAGFCFGNAMLMSMPEYLDHNFLLTNDFKTVFGWINLVLALPVLFYSGNDYFIKAWKGLKVGQLNIDVPIALGILTLFARSAYEILTITGSGYIDSLAGLVFFLLIGKWYQGKTYQALSFERDYTSYFPVSVTCLIDDEPFDRQLKELKKGDIVLIHNDELIPADGKVVKGKGNIDYSFVTGESVPDQKSVGQLVYAGGRQKGGELFIQLEKEVNTSELTQMWNTDVFKKEDQRLQTWVDKVSKYFTLAIIVIALMTGIYWWMTDVSVVWNAVTAVLIVACPCALALVLPFAYGHAMRAMGRGGLYLKNAEVIESLAQVEGIIFDKTGTLTTTTSSIHFHGPELSEEQVRVLRSGLGNSAHPLSRTIHDQLVKGPKLPIDHFQEETGKGFIAKVGGHTLKVGSKEFVGVDIPESSESVVCIAIDEVKGYFTIGSEYRKDAFSMLKRLKRQFRLFLLSGDNDAERERLQPYFEELNFHQKPLDKLNYLKAQNGHQLMIGDGLNDAGALKQASVGFAVAEDIHQFSPACDGILSAQQLTKLPSILKFSKSVIGVVFMAFGLSFLYNIVGLSFAVTGHLTPIISAILMPISSVTVVGFVTLLVSQKSRRDGWIR